jgi:hypothetical protein
MNRPIPHFTCEGAVTFEIAVLGGNEERRILCSIEGRKKMEGWRGNEDLTLVLCWKSTILQSLDKSFDTFKCSILCHTKVGSCN